MSQETFSCGRKFNTTIDEHSSYKVTWLALPVALLVTCSTLNSRAEYVRNIMAPRDGLVPAAELAVSGVTAGA